jgi:anti-sigma factor RsiW
VHLDEARLNEYLDGRIEGPAAQAIRQHLRSCGTCRNRLAEIRHLTRALQSLPEAALSRDLSGPVLAHLQAGPARRWLSWLTLLEALGATGLATFFWPRVAEVLTPVFSGPSLAAITGWLQSGRAWLAGFQSQLDFAVADLASVVDSWARVPTPGTGLAMPLVAALGLAALALGILGNGVLLRALPERRSADPSFIRSSE